MLHRRFYLLLCDSLVFFFWLFVCYSKIKINVWMYVFLHFNAACTCLYLIYYIIHTLLCAATWVLIPLRAQNFLTNLYSVYITLPCILCLILCMYYIYNSGLLMSFCWYHTDAFLTLFFSFKPTVCRASRRWLKMKSHIILIAALVLLTVLDIGWVDAHDRTAKNDSGR